MDQYTLFLNEGGETYASKRDFVKKYCKNVHLKIKQKAHGFCFLHVNRKHTFYCLHVLVFGDRWANLKPRPN